MCAESVKELRTLLALVLQLKRKQNLLQPFLQGPDFCVPWKENHRREN